MKAIVQTGKMGDSDSEEDDKAPNLNNFKMQVKPKEVVP